MPTLKSSSNVTKSIADCTGFIQKNLSDRISEQDKLLQAVTNCHKNSTIKVLNYLIPACYKMPSVWYGYKHMADQLGFCPRTIQRAIHELRDLGLIEARYRLMTSNLYKVNPKIYLYKRELRDKLSSLWSKSVGLSLLLLVGNVVPSGKKNYLYNLSSLTSVRGNQYSVTLPGRGVKLKNTGRKRMAVETGKIIISPTLKEITQELQLTRHGQCKLLAFDDGILTLVWEKSRYFLNGFKNPICWIIKKCVEESTLQQMKIDWDIYYLLLDRYGISKSQPFSLKEEEPKNGIIPVVDRTEFNATYLQKLQQNQQQAQQRLALQYKDKKLPSWLEECTQRFLQGKDV